MTVFVNYGGLASIYEYLLVTLEKADLSFRVSNEGYGGDKHDPI